ncbi:MAG: TonB-dependent receptor [Ekhidna sp.]
MQVFACCVSFICVAQDSTRVLDQVDIIGIDLSRFSSGTSLKSIKKSNSGSLTAIENQSTIYFKNYGSQQLSTISLRGTSASHTNVIWNGIPVNSPTLGQTDFSVWPLFLTNQLLIQKGGGSSLFGSGAIGGTVILDNSAIQRDSLLNLYIGYGSFGQKDAGLRLHMQHNQFTHEVALFGSLLENDFQLADGTRQEHASVNRLGFSNRLGFEYQNGQFFSEIAFAKNDRDIQPTRTSASRSTLESQNIRAVLNNELHGNLTQHSTLGFISDQTVFNDNSITKSYRIAATHSIERPIQSFLFVRLGGTGIHEWAKSDNFEGIEKQTQGHLFASGTVFNAIGSVTVNLRQAFYRKDVVFIPSLGLETAALGIGSFQFNFKGQVSRDYRAPTFNDLFWRPGGNPNLQPERSMNYELGLEVGSASQKLEITGFTSEISNWIQWTPTDGIWSPQNIREVRTKGIEITLNSNHSIRDLKLSINSEYSYIRSTDKGLAEGNQLPYVPKHSAMASATLIYFQSSIEFITNYTGRRFTTLSNSRANRIDDFFLMEMRLTRTISWGSALIKAAINVQNIADVNYENLKNTAMPGRAFLIELTTKL